MLNQHVHYCQSFDGAALAFATSGHGRPVLLLPSWVTHLEYQWRSSAWRPWLQALSENNTLVRYDPRGCGLSERGVDGMSFETWVRDALAVADAAGLDRVPVVGIGHGGATAVAMAQRVPDRVERLVLCGAFARGHRRRGSNLHGRERARLMFDMIRIGWNDRDQGLMRSFATQVQPEGPIEHLDSWCELQRRAASREAAMAFLRIMFETDVQEAARQVSCPALVAHADRDPFVPLAEGRLLARLMPHAEFLELESPNHFLLPQEPAWHHLRDALDDFLPAPPQAVGAFAVLTPREREVLDLLAQGLDNAHIATALGIRIKTVRNYMLMLLDKLDIDSRGEAIVVAREAGFGRHPAGTGVPVKPRH